MGNYGCQPFFSQWREILVDWLLEKWNCNDLYIHEFLNIYEKHRQIIYMKSWWSIPTGWWLTYPSEKYESQIGWSSQLLGKIKNSMVPLLIIISHINPILIPLKTPWNPITKSHGSKSPGMTNGQSIEPSSKHIKRRQMYRTSVPKGHSSAGESGWKPQLQMDCPLVI